jgi:hypothetical protein
LAKLLIRSRGGIQYVEHAEGHGDKMFEAVCQLGLMASCRSGARRFTDPAHPKCGSRSKIRRRRPQRGCLKDSRSSAKVNAAVTY